MTRPRACQIAHIAITVDGDNTHLAVPAYTRTWDSFDDTIEHHRRQYSIGALGTHTQPSTADFAMYLLAQAAQEPREQYTEG